MASILPSECETLIIGGGVVGLSIAYELASRNVDGVVVVDRQQPGQEASWAGAGILPPGSWYSSHTSSEQLAALSKEQNTLWTRKLLEETSIDSHFCRSGAIHLATSPEEIDALEEKFAHWNAIGIESQQMPLDEVAELEPALRLSDGVAAYFLPDESQIDNRQHCASLLQAVTKRGVNVCFPCEVTSLDQRSNKEIQVSFGDQSITTNRVVMALGAWCKELGEQLGLDLRVRPIRGQMLEFEPISPMPLNHIVYHSGEYLVPRHGNRIIVGSTVEDVGFDKSTTEHSIDSLTVFARRLLPDLEQIAVRESWAGLRPASFDGLPFLGRSPHANNVFVAAGHFRSGLQMASGTAKVLVDLMLGEQPLINLTPFALER